MRALARVGMFVEMGAVKIGEAVSVAGKMSRCPIEKDADASLMAAINKLHELRGRTISAGGREIAQSLVAPGAIKRVLHDGEQLDVGVAEAFYVRDKLIGEFTIGEPAIMFPGDAPPGTEMDFIDGDGGFEPILL